MSLGLPSQFPLDKARRKKRRELSAEQKQEIQEAFNLFDTDKDQHIDYHELKVKIILLYHYLLAERCVLFRIYFFGQVAMRALGFDVKKADVLKVLKDYDRDGTGKISFQDFSEVSKSFMLVLINARQTNNLTICQGFGGTCPDILRLTEYNLMWSDPIITDMCAVYELHMSCKLIIAQCTGAVAGECTVASRNCLLISLYHIMIG